MIVLWIKPDWAYFCLTIIAFIFILEIDLLVSFGISYSKWIQILEAWYLQGGIYWTMNIDLTGMLRIK